MLNIQTKINFKILDSRFFYILKLILFQIENRVVSKKHYTIVSLENETSRERRLAEGSCPSTPGYPSNHSHTGSPTLSSTSRQDEEDDDGNNALF